MCDCVCFRIRLWLQHIRSVRNKVLMIKITLFPLRRGVVRLVLLLHIGSTLLSTSQYVCMYTFASSSHVFSVVVRKYGLFNGCILLQWVESFEFCNWPGLRKKTIDRSFKLLYFLRFLTHCAMHSAHSTHWKCTHH